MGEEKKASKDGGSGGDKKKDAGAGPAAAGPQPIVLKIDLHCAGCASKVRKAIKRAPGVESVVPDVAAGKVIVTGAADAVELKERIEARAKKPVQIVSAGAGPPKKEKKADGGGEKKAEKEKGGGGGEKKGEKEKGGGDKKAEKEKGADKPKEEKKPKESKEETVTLKIRLHCDGCIDRIKRRIYKIKGVKDVAVDNAKDLVKVTGTMDAAALPAYLRVKLSRPVEVVAPSKKDGGGDKKADDKKDKGAGDGGDKKKDGGGGEEKKDKDKSAAASASVAPMPLADAGMYQMPPQYGYTPYPPAPGAYYGGGAPPPIPAFYPNAGFGQYPPPSYPYSAHVHAPQMFSDENPNACSVM